MATFEKVTSRWVVVGLGAATLLASRVGLNPSQGQDGDRAPKRSSATPAGKAVITEPVKNSKATRSVPADVAAKAVTKTSSHLDADQVAAMKESIRSLLLKRAGGEVPMPSFPPNGTDAWCREQYAAAPKEPRARHALLAQHLMVADRMLKDRELTRRRQGLGVALEAGQFAATLNDPELAGAIGDAYVLANLDIADVDHTRKWSRERVLQMATVVYLGAGQDAKVVECWRRLLAIAHNRNMADFARFKLAQALEREQRYDEALTYLRAIDPKRGMAGVRTLIPAVERKLQDQRSHAKPKT